RPGGAFAAARRAGVLGAGGAAGVVKRRAPAPRAAGRGRERPARRPPAELMERVHRDAHGARRDARLAGRDGWLPVLVPAGREDYAAEKEGEQGTGKLAHGG